MGLIDIVGLAVGVSMDAVAVALVCSMSLGEVTGRQFFRLSFHFGLFQALMPLLGWAAGRSVHAWSQSWDHWLVFVILAFLGSKAAYSSLCSDKNEDSGVFRGVTDPTRGMTLMALCIATSLDAMAVGLSFPVLKVSPAVPVLMIGATTGCLTLLGMKLGSRVGSRFGAYMQAAGGFVLIALGLKILGEHLIA